MAKHLEQARYRDAQRLGNPKMRGKIYLHDRIAKAKRENPRIPRLNEAPKSDELLEHEMAKAEMLGTSHAFYTIQCTLSESHLSLD